MAYIPEVNPYYSQLSYKIIARFVLWQADKDTNTTNTGDSAYYWVFSDDPHTTCGMSCSSSSIDSPLARGVSAVCPGGVWLGLLAMHMPCLLHCAVAAREARWDGMRGPTLK